MRPGKLKFSAYALGLIFALAPMGGAGAADVVVKRFTGGTGQNAVGIIEASQDTEIDGPQALTTDENGEIYLLDQVNGRIVGFDPKTPAAEARILEFPDQLQPTDLIVRKSDILVWDGSVHTLQSSTGKDNTSFRGLEEVNTRAADDQTVVSAFAQMGSLGSGRCDRTARRKYPRRNNTQASGATPPIRRFTQCRIDCRRCYSRRRSLGCANGSPSAG